MVPEDLDPPDRRLRVLSWVVTVLLVLGFGACLSEGANEPPDPQLPRVELRGHEFGRVGIRIAPGADQSPTQLRCALLAATEAERRRGLMEVDLEEIEGFVGMVFRFSGDSQGAFHMRSTRLPLSIAWFDRDGAFVGAADMAPCPDSEAACPVYAPDKPYRYALEVPLGKLAELGVGPGSKLVLTGSSCPRT